MFREVPHFKIEAFIVLFYQPVLLSLTTDLLAGCLISQPGYLTSTLPYSALPYSPSQIVTYSLLVFAVKMHSLLLCVERSCSTL